jgi:hypothetical protein
MTIAVLVFLSLRENEKNHLLSTIPIHWLLRRKFVLYNVWGVTHGFTSSTSSPLWTLLSLMYLTFGVVRRLNVIIVFVSDRYLYHH